jgi:integrase
MLADAVTNQDVEVAHHVIDEQVQKLRAPRAYGVLDDTADLGPGDERAKRFADVAYLGAGKTLREVWADWMLTCDLTPGTKAKYKRAFDEFLSFLAVPDTVPNAVTFEQTRAYVDWLNTKATNAKGEPLDPETKQGRALALASFWKHLEQTQRVPRGLNLWHGHVFVGARDKGRQQQKEREFTPEEMLMVVDGPERGDGATYTKRTLLQLLALGFYIGARIEEICSRKVEDFDNIKGGYLMHVRDAKTRAGVRDLPILHAIPVAVIRERIGKRKDGFLFDEFVPGGPDNKRSWQVDKAMNDYLRDDLKLPKGVRFHSTRHSFATRMEECTVDTRWAARYFGHSVPGLMGKRYSHAKVLREVAHAIRYPAKVERAFAKALAIHGQK